MAITVRAAGHYTTAAPSTTQTWQLDTFSVLGPDQVLADLSGDNAYLRIGETYYRGSELEGQTWSVSYPITLWMVGEDTTQNSHYNFSYTSNTSPTTTPVNPQNSTIGSFTGSWIRIGNAGVEGDWSLALEDRKLYLRGINVTSPVTHSWTYLNPIRRYPTLLMAIGNGLDTIDYKSNFETIIASPQYTCGYSEDGVTEYLAGYYLFQAEDDSETVGGYAPKTGFLEQTLKFSLSTGSTEPYSVQKILVPTHSLPTTTSQIDYAMLGIPRVYDASAGSYTTGYWRRSLYSLATTALKSENEYFYGHEMVFIQPINQYLTDGTTYQFYFSTSGVDLWQFAWTMVDDGSIGFYDRATAQDQQYIYSGAPMHAQTEGAIEPFGATAWNRFSRYINATRVFQGLSPIASLDVAVASGDTCTATIWNTALNAMLQCGGATMLVPESRRTAAVATQNSNLNASMVHTLRDILWSANIRSKGLLFYPGDTA